MAFFSTSDPPMEPTTESTSEPTTEPICILLPDASATRAAGLALGGVLPPDAVLLLEGDLGAGKTTLAKGVCEALGIRPAGVTSPTYTLVNIYPGPRPVYHVDLYRLDTPEALLDMDMDDWLNPDGVTLIEWPEHARRLLQGRSLWTVTLSIPEDGKGEGEGSGRWLSLTGPATLLEDPGFIAALNHLDATPSTSGPDHHQRPRKT